MERKDEGGQITCSIKGANLAYRRYRIYKYTPLPRDGKVVWSGLIWAPTRVRTRVFAASPSRRANNLSADRRDHDPPGTLP